MFCVLRMEPETSPAGVVVSCHGSIFEAKVSYDRSQDYARAVGSSPDILVVVEVACEIKPGRAVRPDMIVHKFERAEIRAVGNDYGLH